MYLSDGMKKISLSTEVITWKSLNTYFISFLLAYEHKATDKKHITELPQAASRCRQGNLLPAGTVYIF